MSSMRRIVAFDRVTADGYFAAPDGNLDWAVPEEELDRSAAESLGEADTMLFGRKTYEAFESFWPRAVDNSSTAPDPHAAGRRTQDMRALAIWINETAKIVFSRTRKDVTWKNSRLIHEFNPREIEAMKKQPGKDIMLFGSGSIASLLTQHGLIDEYQFVVAPILLGDGRSLLTGVSTRVKVNLVEAKTYPSGNVRLRYARAK